MTAQNAIFTSETFKFFRDVGRNNHKTWMDANRERYQAHIVQPFRALLGRLAPFVTKLNPEFDTAGRTGGNFSRINRDIRFAKDKSPYRTQMYLFFASTAVQDGDDAQLYVGVSAEAATIGFRMYGDTRNSRLARITSPRARENTKWLEQQKRRLGRKYESYWYTSEKGEWTKHNGWPTQPEDWKHIQGWIVRRKMKPVAATNAGFVNDAAKSFRELFSLYRFASLPDWRG